MYIHIFVGIEMLLGIEGSSSLGGKSGTDVKIFKTFSPKKLLKILAFLLKQLLVFSQKMIKTLGFFRKKIHFFLRKLSKIAENCDHNINSCLFTVSSFCRIGYV
jgi:hypothetical protein